MGMKISAINIPFIPKTKCPSKTNQFYLGSDTVSFSGKININQEMKNLPSEAFPSIGLQNFMSQSLTSNHRI